MDQLTAREERASIGRALRAIRQSRGLTQEDFALVSSRTYMSALERGLQSPTTEKLSILGSMLGCRAVTVMVLAEVLQRPGDRREALSAVLAGIAGECESLLGRIPQAGLDRGEA